jgi:peptidoglycan/LPS O-acetylase OafA/YrhL
VIRRFYARRALRIFPAFYAVVALTYLAGVPEVRTSIGWHVSYLSNFYFFLRGSWQGPVSHFWSLAVEEQFYLVWPCLMLFLPRTALFPALLLAILTAPLVRAGILFSPAQVSYEMLPVASLDTLGIGALVALLSRDLGRAPIPVERAASVFLLVGLPGYVLLRALHSTGIFPEAIVLEQTFLAMCYAWVVLGASKGFAGPAGKALELTGLRALGRISYGLYLWHNFVPLAFTGLVRSFGLGPEITRGLPRVGLLFMMTVCVSSLSWFVVERPLNRLKRYFPYHDDDDHDRTRPAPEALSSGTGLDSPT